MRIHSKKILFAIIPLAGLLYTTPATFADEESALEAKQEAEQKALEAKQEAQKEAADELPLTERQEDWLEKKHDAQQEALEDKHEAEQELND